jgi:hypothetical protein
MLFKNMFEYRRIRREMNEYVWSTAMPHSAGPWSSVMPHGAGHYGIVLDKLVTL